MLTVISPAKALDFDAKPKTRKHTMPSFLDRSEQLITQLRKQSPARLSKLMGISDKLAKLNRDRYRDWHLPFDTSNSKQAVLAFRGDVYRGLQADGFTQWDFNFAQKHLRILSGLYGLLKPLDLIQPYRLEMGTELKNCKGADLYSFWGNLLTEVINEEITEQRTEYLINLASDEYFKAVNCDILQARLITPVFKDFNRGEYRVLSFLAKRARGTMVGYIVKNRIDKAADIKGFNLNGYRFSKKLSTDDRWIFTRKER